MLKQFPLKSVDKKLNKFINKIHTISDKYAILAAY